MDIRCPSCSTLYEFDESRISPKGVNVRCSACGQVFKVRKAEPDEPKILWMVKRESTGEVINFDDLSTLQRWIIEQKVSRRDMISKTGDTWKSLGSINELQAFFKVVDEINEPKRGSRDTDGYLTANQRASMPGGGGPGYTPTPTNVAAVTVESDASTRLMAGLDAKTASPSTYAVGSATVAHGASPHDLPPPRPANQSAPRHSVQVDDSGDADTSPNRRVHANKVGAAADGYSIGGSAQRTERYSLGNDAPGREPTISFAAPALDTGRSSDYTAEYSSLRRSRGRWPTLLLALLLLVAGVLIVVAAFAPQMLGFGDPTDETPIAALDGGAGALALADDRDTDDDAAPAEGSGNAAAEASGEAPAEGSGDGEGSGDSDPDADDADEADAADDAVGADEPPADTGTNVAAVNSGNTRRDTGAAAAPRDTGSARPTRDTAPAEQREEPTEEPAEREEPAVAAPSGYDGLMSAGNEELRAGNNQEALNHFSNATDARPSSAEAHVGVARAYEAMGRHDLAAVRYERATSVNSRYTPAWLGLGDARRRSGDTGGACQAYRRVLSIVRTGRSADRARRATEDMGCPAE